ncbi:MAG: hypothetical protein KBD55_02695 [Candidatus Pacebacteria bacterium]|nr:hypothetical protein [Candidatus Paceibacterota bacterium]
MTIKKILICLVLLLVASPLLAESINLNRAKVLEVIKEENSQILGEIDK